MIKEQLPVAVLLALFCIPAFADGDTTAGQAKFEEVCEQCHFEDDFDDEAKSVIEAMILAIINGEAKHRPSLKEITAEDAANLAAFFSAQ